MLMQLDTARLFVRDLEAARRFYAQTLGLRLVADGSAHGYIVFDAGAATLVVETVGPEAPADDQALVGRFTGLSFSTPDIAALHQALLARGVVFCEAPERQPWGGIVATLLDPAGNALQLAQHPPRTTQAPQVTLREITADTVRAVCKLAVAPHQQGFVAPNAVSLAQALFSPEAWYRAIYADDEPAGFVMLADESRRSPPPAEPGIGVWRFMVDARFQGRGIGRAALQQVIALVRARGVFDTLEISYVPGPGCPEPFYLGLGFQHTGRLDEDEVVLELPLREFGAGAGSA